MSFYRVPVSFLVQNSPCAGRNSGQSLWEPATFAPCSTEVWPGQNAVLAASRPEELRGLLSRMPPGKRYQFFDPGF